MLKYLALLALLASVTRGSENYPTIEDLQVTGATLTSVTLSWTLDVSEYIPVKYTLVTDGILTIEFFYTGDNTYTVSGLQSCHEYYFALTADYEHPATGPTAEIYGSTLDETPGSVSSLTLTDTVLTWLPPTNARCVDFYNVCYESTVTGYGDCKEVIDEEYDLGEVSGCDEVIVSVNGVAGALQGPAAETTLTTDYASPSEPRDFEVVILSETMALLAWNAPADNPACVKDFSIVYGPAENLTSPITVDISTQPEREEHEGDDGDVREEDGLEDGDDGLEDGDDGIEFNTLEGPSGQEFTAILENLLPCTEYRFGVSTVSEQDELSDPVYQNRATNGTAPSEIPDIAFVKEEDSITITWGDVSEEQCLESIQICYSDPVEIKTECFDVPKSPNTWTLDGLKACREYDFMVRGQSSDGDSGPPKYISVSTKDVAPGPVREMHLGSIGVTSVTVTYMDPLLYPECVDQFVITYKNLLEGTTSLLSATTSKKRAASGSNYTDQINGLDACALYEVGVYAVSASGLEGNITTQITQLKDTTPEPPITGTMLSSTENSATLLWYAPQDTRYCVNAYTVKISQPGGGPGTLETVPVTSFNEEVLHTFNGLGPCTGYVAEMQSWNRETDTESDFVQVVTDIWTTC